jgi:hypothetical protein
VRAILALCTACTWDRAVGEWTLDRIYVTRAPGRCLCGHKILEHCVLRNTTNANRAVVGNECVGRFFNLPSGRLFRCLKRIMRDVCRALDATFVEYAYGEGWVNEWERDFCLDTLGTPARRLSPRQRATREAINRQVIRHATREGGRDA